MTDAIVSTLLGFAELEPNWDSYGAPRIASGAILAANRLVESIGVTPTTKGGVSVYLASEGVIVEFGPDGAVVDLWVSFADVRDYVTAVFRVDASGSTDDPSSGYVGPEGT